VHHCEAIGDTVKKCEKVRKKSLSASMHKLSFDLFKGRYGTVVALGANANETHYYYAKEGYVVVLPINEKVLKEGIATRFAVMLRKEKKKEPENRIAFPDQSNLHYIGASAHPHPPREVRKAASAKAKVDAATAIQHFCEITPGHVPELALCLGDCVDVMINKLSAHFDFIFIDPPTGCSVQVHTPKARYDTLWKRAFWVEVAKACKLRLAPGGSVMVTPGSCNGPDSQTARDDASAAFKECGFRMSTFYWQKPGYVGNNKMNSHKPVPEQEQLLVFSLQTNTHYQAIGQTSSTIVVGQHDQHNQHMGIKHWKPLELFPVIYKMFVPPRGSVLDITLNSGISAFAARECKLDFTGIEIDKDFLADAQRRLH
jgi:hypothetical protein